MAYTGYRIVLDSIHLSKNNLTFLLTNIGVSRIFHGYYKLYIQIKDNNDNIVYSQPSNFDFRTLDYCHGKPLSYLGQLSKRLSFQLPKIKGKVFVVIKDIDGIEYPMTLSNYGRQYDGGYYLGNI